MLETLILSTYRWLIVPLLISVILALITIKFDALILNLLSFAGFIVYLTLMILFGANLTEIVLYTIPFILIYAIKSLMWRKKHDV